MFLFKNSCFVGVDINPQQIQVVKFSQGKLHLKQCLSRPLAAGLMIKGRLQNIAPLVSLLQNWVKETGTMGWSAAMTLPLNQVLMKRIQLPRTLSIAECEWQIQQQLPQYFLGMTALQDELNFDFLRQKNSDEVLLIAAKKTLCQLYQEMADAVGLTLIKLEVDMFPLLRYVLSELPTREAIAIFDVCQDEVNFIVCSNNQIIYSEVVLKNQLFKACQIFLSIYHEVILKKIFWVGDVIDAEKAKFSTPSEIVTPKDFPAKFIKAVGLFRKYCVRS